jgi:hypothetical protein
MKYLVFHNDSDSSYMNSVDNFRGISTGNDVLNFHFKAAAVGDDGSASAGYDKVVIAVTSGQEEVVLEFLGRLIANTRDAVTVVASDVSGATKYAHSDITGVTSITLSATGNYKSLMSWTGDTTLTAADSGKWIYAGDATALDLNLPAASGNSGVYYDIFIQKAQTGNTHIMAQAGDFFEGALLISDADTATENLFFAVANTAEDDVINLDDDTKGRLAGGFIQLVCDGTKWHVQGRLNGTGALATPFHTDES